MIPVSSKNKKVDKPADAAALSSLQADEIEVTFEDFEDVPVLSNKAQNANADVPIAMLSSSLLEDELTGELSDDDLISVDGAPVSTPSPISTKLRAVLSTIPPPVVVPKPANVELTPETPAPRRTGRRSSPALRAGVTWESAQADVADECLATIAAETSRTRLSDLSITPPPASSSMPLQLSIARVRTAMEERFARQISGAPASSSSSAFPPVSSFDDDEGSWPVIPPASSDSVLASSTPSSRLPPVSPPPFRSGPSLLPPARSPFARGGLRGSHIVDDDNLATLPVPMKAFARIVPDAEASSRSLLAAKSKSTGGAKPIKPTGLHAAGVVPREVTGSISPVALANADADGKRETATGTVIVMHPPRARAPWVIASAAVGALVAAAVMHFASPAPAPSATTAREAPETIANAPVVAPISRPAASATPASVVQFGEADAIKVTTAPVAAPVAPAPAKPAAPAHVAAAPKPAKPAAPPRVSAPISMPDGSLGLANNSSTTTTPAASSPKSPAPLPATSAAPPRKPLPMTPEQELAEAQLRAALR